MQGSRRMWIILVVVLVVLFALVGFYIWLVGGSGSADSGEKKTPSASTGLVHVRSIYTYGDNENLVRPTGLGADDQGGFCVTLLDSAKVVQFDANGDFVRAWGERGTNPGQLVAPTGVAVDRLAGQVYVIDRSRLKLIAYDLQGAYLWEVPILNPINVAVDVNGDVLVNTFGPIARFSSEGQSQGQFGSRGPDPGQFDYPRETVIADDGTAFVADTNNARIQHIETSGDITATVLWIAGTKVRDAEDTGGLFLLPTGVAVDANGRVVVLDSFRHTVSLLDQRDGSVITDFGGERRGVSNATFNFPTNIVHLKGDLFAVTDTGNDRVQIIRLVAPGARQPWNLYPGLRWLGLLPLLLLFLVFGRRRTYVTDETLSRALADGNARLVLSALKRPSALPDTVERYGDEQEEGVRVGDHLRVLKVAEGHAEDAEDRLLNAARSSGAERFLFRRHVIVCADDAQCARVAERGARTLSYEEILRDFKLED